METNRINEINEIVFTYIILLQTDENSARRLKVFRAIARDKDLLLTYWINEASLFIVRIVETWWKF